MFRNLSSDTLTLFHLLSVELNGVELDASRLRELTEDEWNGLFSSASRMDMAAMISNILSKIGNVDIPFDVRLKFTGMQEIAERAYSFYMKALCELAHFFNQNGIPTMVIKGISLARFYPNPQHRKCGDIDIYQFGLQPKADSMISSFYGVDVHQSEVGHHTNYFFHGIGIENHYHFITTYYGRRSVQLEQIIEAEALHYRCMGVSGEKILTPSANFNAIFLVRHMAGHFLESHISVGQLLDWMLFLKNEYQLVDWMEMWNMYKEFHFDKFVNAINGVLIRYLRMPSVYAYNYSENIKIENQIIADVVRGGRILGEKPSSNRSVCAELYQYIVSGWKYRIFGMVGVVELVKKCYYYLRRPADYEKRLVVQNGDGVC